MQLPNHETVDAVVINGHRIILEKYTGKYRTTFCIVHDMEQPRIVRHVGKTAYVKRLWKKNFKTKDES